MEDPVRTGELVANKYLLEGVIGRGGIGVVFAAQHTTLRSAVALKFLRTEVASDPDVVRRFLREARAVARLRSEHVARVMDAGSLDDGAAYLVMELLEGRDFRAVVKDDGPLSIDVAVDYLMQACEAVAEAHALGIVHRDLKLGNLFLTRGADGLPLVKVLDFGLSKIESSQSHSRLTSENHVFGSPHFMSPEQMRSSRDVDARTDIWSLGVVLYSLLTGRLPFEGPSLAEVCAAVITGGAPRLGSLRPDVPPELEEVVRRCLRPEPEDRYRSVPELVAALAPFNATSGAAHTARVARLVAGQKGSEPPPPVSFVAAEDAAPTVVETVVTPPHARPATRGLLRRYVAVAACAALAAVGADILLRRPAIVAPVAPSMPAAAASPAIPDAPLAATTSATPSVDPPRSVAPPPPAAPRHAPAATARPPAPPARPHPQKSESDVILELPH